MNPTHLILALGRCQADRGGIILSALSVVRATLGILILAISFLLTASSCGGGDGEEILVFAAASLTDVMERLGEEYTEKEGVKVSFNVGGSTAIAQQIIRGAPADAIISAGPGPMDALEERGLLMPDTRSDLLTNQLVLVGSPAVAEKGEIASLWDLASSGARVAIADPDLAPAGRYAREALENVGLWENLEPHIVPSADVRVALGYVKTGSVDAAIVYLTDLGTTEGVVILANIPSESHSPIVYPAGVVEASSHREAARRLLAFLKSPDAGDTFLEYGFTPIDSPTGE